MFKARRMSTFCGWVKPVCVRTRKDRRGASNKQPPYSLFSGGTFVTMGSLRCLTCLLCFSNKCNRESLPHYPKYNHKETKFPSRLAGSPRTSHHSKTFLTLRFHHEPVNHELQCRYPGLVLRACPLPAKAITASWRCH